MLNMYVCELNAPSTCTSNTTVHYEIHLKLLTIGYLTSNFNIVALADDDGGPNLAFKQIMFNNIHNIIALIVY